MQQDPEVEAILRRPPDPARPYLYAGTNVRINKFGILNPFALDLVVRATSGLRGQMLLDHPITGNFDLAQLCAFHRHLFQDVYPWAGEIRIVDFDRSEDPYTLPENILPECDVVFAAFAGEQKLQGLNLLQFTERLAYYLHRLYQIHPFRDGNGRSLRAFFSQLCRERGFEFELGSVPQAERHATARAAHQGDHAPLVALVRSVTRPI